MQFCLLFLYTPLSIVHSYNKPSHHHTILFFLSLQFLCRSNHLTDSSQLLTRPNCRSVGITASRSGTVLGSAHHPSFPWLWLWNLFLLLLTFLNVLNNMDYTSIYFLSVTSTECRTRARSELLNVSLVSLPWQVLYSSTYIGSWQLFISRSLLPPRLYAGLLSQTEPTDWAPC